ncbi:YqkE family protein [Anaerobacillus sp. MEB173]|uniref:YqkE family protein n=1 Tax=Anaerobacillus sp. MEB173 TaxID=3383345 RepID=UPI003F8FD820
MKKNENILDIESRIDKGIWEKLKDTKKNLKLEEERKEEALRQKKIKERIEREKNKSFEELFEESNLDWKKFK